MLLLVCMYRGVVQLFNAVHKQQALLEGKLTEAGPSERRREKAVQSLTKGQFLDMLKDVKVCMLLLKCRELLFSGLLTHNTCTLACRHASENVDVHQDNALVYLCNDNDNDKRLGLTSKGRPARSQKNTVH